MSNKKVQRWGRYSLESLSKDTEEDPKGKLFISPLGQVNLADVFVVHAGLDTVRQLYTGTLFPRVLEQIESSYSQGFGTFFSIGGKKWLLASGGKSGYQYRLQDSDTGLIVFVKSRYVDSALPSSHIKIECSPHWLLSRDYQQMGRDLDALSCLFLDGAKPSGVAVHICADVQGWDPNNEEQDFLDCLVTRAKRITSHRSQKVEYMELGEVGLTYGRGQSYLLGSASTVQMAVYRKDLEVKKSDKVEFWQKMWSSSNTGGRKIYDKRKNVWRIEFRFHHTVLEEFGRGAIECAEAGGTGEIGDWKHITGAAEQLQKLWSYGLENFRLQLKAEGIARHIHPVWQLLLEDVKQGLGEGLLCKRVKKKPGEGSEKNLLLAVGNMLSVYTRNRYSPQRAFRCLKRSGVYDDLYKYMARRAHFRGEHFSEGEVYNFVRDGLLRRTLLGKAA